MHFHVSPPLLGNWMLYALFTCSGELEVSIFTNPTAPGKLDVSTLGMFFSCPTAPGELDVCISRFFLEGLGWIQPVRQ